MQQFSILFWQFHNLFGAKKETSGFALTVLLALWFHEYEISLFFQNNNSWSVIISISFIKRITKLNLEKKSDILVIYPELNLLRYECDNNYSSHLKMWKQLSQSISWKKKGEKER